MNSHQIKRDGTILIPERGLIYFIIITVCIAIIALVIGYYWCARDVENQTIAVAHLYMEGYRDSLAMSRAIAESALVKADVALTCWKLIKAKE